MLNLTGVFSIIDWLNWNNYNNGKKNSNGMMPESCQCRSTSKRRKEEDKHEFHQI